MAGSWHCSTCSATAASAFRELTLVDSDLTYDNHERGEQFALEGLSDSSNVVAFYEKGKLGSARGVQLA